MEFFATANTIPAHISDTQKGDKTIVLLHGYLETLYIWQEFTDYLTKEGYRVISMDLPGHGLSGYNNPESDMEFSSRFVNDILNVCSVERCIVAGHSMGGYIAEKFLSLFPERTEALILLNSTPFADSAEKKEERLREIKVIEEGKLQYLASLSIPKMYATSNLRRMDEKIFETIELCETHDPSGIISSIRGLISREDNTELLKGTKTPLLFIVGEEDNYFKKDIFTSLEKEIANAEFSYIANTGHISFEEDPQGVISIINSFYQRKVSKG